MGQDSQVKESSLLGFVFCALEAGATPPHPPGPSGSILQHLALLAFRSLPLVPARQHRKNLALLHPRVISVAPALFAFFPRSPIEETVSEQRHPLGHGSRRGGKKIGPNLGS